MNWTDYFDSLLQAKSWDLDQRILWRMEMDHVRVVYPDLLCREIERNSVSPV